MNFRNLIAILSVALGLIGAGPCLAQTDASQPMAAASSAQAIGSYVLAAGDKLKISVYDEDDLSGQYVVSPTGVVSLPLAGNVSAAGLSIAAFQANLKSALQPKYLKNARIAVELVDLRPFFILGEVDKPGQYTYSTGLTVLDAVATAGGFTYRANTRRVYIKRANESDEQKIPLTASTLVSPGDTIRIEERHF